LNEYQHLRNTGGDMKKFMKEIQFSCRDNGRTPFQWDSSANAGFSTGTPWIKVNPDYTMINAAAQEKEASSCLNYFRKMVKLRKDNPVLVYGKYELLDKGNPNVYAYTRELNRKKLLILLNFTSKLSSINIGIDLSKAKVLIDNYADGSANGQLKPYETVIYEL
jgi:oligo-1,6-glucosidase